MSKKRPVGKTVQTPKDKSPVITQRDKIAYNLNIKERNDLTDKQKEILAVAADKETKCIIIDGLYGTSKTYLALLASLKLLNERKVSDIIYIRNPVEASTTGKIGFIKGSTDEKMAPYNGPLYDKLEELLPEGDLKKLKADERIEGIPLGFTRGRSWNCKAIIVDEASSMTWDDLFLIMTRCGEFTKIFLIGDSKNQNDIGTKAGFLKLFQLFNDRESMDNGVHCFELKAVTDIVRSEFLRFIMRKTGLIQDEKATKNADKDDPRQRKMFEED